MRPPRPEPGALSDAPYLGFDGKPHRHRMGIRRLDPGRWLEPDAHAAAQRRIKERLLAEVPERVLIAPDTAAVARASRDLAHALATAGAPLPAVAAERDPAAVIAACGSATQEDWCVMVREDAWRLRAACVCFPSRWVLAAKRGGTIAEIHRPVPGYEEQLGGLVERLLDRLAPDQPVWRVNWNLWDDPRLHQPTEDPAAATWDLPAPDEVGDRVFLRVERQTLRRLSSDAVAFGIRVHQRPLGRISEQPGAVERLDATLRGLGDAPARTRKLGRLAPAVSAWVRTQLDRREHAPHDR